MLSALNKSSAITVFAVKSPTKVAFPVVVSPSEDAVMASEPIMFTISLVLSNQV